MGDDNAATTSGAVGGVDIIAPPLNKQDEDYKNSVAEAEAEAAYEGSPKTVEKDFTYPTHTDPQRHVGPPSIYLDDVGRQNAEIVRAKLEGREPDLENPPATVSTVLKPTSVVRAESQVGSVIPVDVTLPVMIGTPDEETDTEPAEETKDSDIPLFSGTSGSDTVLKTKSDPDK